MNTSIDLLEFKKLYAIAMADAPDTNNLLPNTGEGHPLFSKIINDAIEFNVTDRGISGFEQWIHSLSNLERHMVAGKSSIKLFGLRTTQVNAPALCEKTKKLWELGLITSITPSFHNIRGSTLTYNQCKMKELTLRKGLVDRLNVHDVCRNTNEDSLIRRMTATIMFFQPIVGSAGELNRRKDEIIRGDACDEFCPDNTGEVPTPPSNLLTISHCWDLGNNTKIESQNSSKKLTSLVPLEIVQSKHELVLHAYEKGDLTAIRITVNDDGNELFNAHIVDKASLPHIFEHMVNALEERNVVVERCELKAEISLTTETPELYDDLLKHGENNPSNPLTIKAK